jgi:hypothetical protein
MESENRIIQYCLHLNKLDIDKPNKKTYYIVPYIENNINFENWKL